MDTICNWEHKALASELSQGMELRFHLGLASFYETQEMLLHGILSSYDKAMLILNHSSSASQQPQLVGTAVGFPESSISANASPQSTEFDKGFKDQQEQKDVSKKRKLLLAWTEQARVCSENGMDGPNDDWYSWRKYGQKDILGATYPRSTCFTMPLLLSLIIQMSQGIYNLWYWARVYFRYVNKNKASGFKRATTDKM